MTLGQNEESADAGRANDAYVHCLAAFLVAAAPGVTTSGFCEDAALHYQHSRRAARFRMADR